jgi:membrane protein YqaA with SNARE-associated domain
MAYLSLFVASLVAATILPAQSEMILGGLLLTGNYNTILLVSVASLGNVAGSVINWFLGRGIESFKDKKWFPVSPERLEKTSALYIRNGRWLLFLSWLPIIGDPITVVAGVLKERFLVFLLITAIAKTARYIVLAYIIL